MSESSGLRPRHLNRVLAPEGEVLGLGPSLVLAPRVACGDPNSIPSNLSCRDKTILPGAKLGARSAPAGPAPRKARAQGPKETLPGARDGFLRSSPHRVLANSSAAKYAARLKQGLA